MLHVHPALLRVCALSLHISQAVVPGCLGLAWMEEPSKAWWRPREVGELGSRWQGMNPPSDSDVPEEFPFYTSHLETRNPADG